MSGITVTYKDHMGTDLSVVNAARVSFAKEHDTFQGDKDSGLIRFLARNNHWTPFGQTAVQVHVSAPLFVARQLQKHQIGLVWNEVSRRYVTDRPTFYNVDYQWREAAEDKKQGSGDLLPPVMRGYAEREYCGVMEHALDTYESLISYGVCPEQARMVLPQSMMTEWWWTGNLASCSRIYGLRSKPDTQLETQDFAKKLSEVIDPLFPVSWAALTGRLL